MIRLLTDADFPAVFGHMCRHGDESGRNGDVIFRPRSQHEVMDEVQISQRHRGAWARGLDQPLWLRTWGVFVDNAIVGDPREVAAQMNERFNADDRLMLWFDFNNHDSKRVMRNMNAFMKAIQN